jgi:hypothetical protein
MLHSKGEVMSNFNPYELDDEYKDQEECSKPSKSKKVKTRTLIPNLVHHIRLKSNSQICYLVNNVGKLETHEKVQINGQLYQPKQDLPFICLDNTILKTESAKPAEILNRTEQFLRDFVELPHEQLYLVVSLFVGHTYFVDIHFDVTPILFAFGLLECGKSRLGHLVSLISYRGERCTSPTEATLFRAAEAFKSTLIIDEVKLWGRDGNPQVANLIKSRYKRGMKVSRCNMNKSGEDAIDYFDVYAPLMVYSTESMPIIIKSRCITLIMQQNINPVVEKEINLSETEWIRKQWTLQRFQWMGKKLPDVESKARRRLREITQPLLRVCKIMDESRLEEVIDFIDYMKMRKSEEEGETTEVEILRKIYKQRGLTVNEKFKTADIVEALNRYRSEKDKYSSKYVSTCISRMGFEKTRFHGGRQGFRFDKELIKRLCTKYKLEELDNEIGISDPQEEGIMFTDESKPPFNLG